MMFKFKRHSLVSLIGGSIALLACFSILWAFQLPTPRTPQPPVAHDHITSQDSRWHGSMFALRRRSALYSPKPRQDTSSDPLSDLGGLLGGLLGGDTGTSGKNGNSNPSSSGGIEGIFGDLLGDITSGGSATDLLGKLFGGALSSLGDTILGELDGPAFFLGIGLGTGAATGLNMSTTEQANATASSVAAANGVAPTGVNGIAENLGNGLAAAAVPLIAANVSQSNGPISLPSAIAGAVFPLAQGIGNGTVSGLDISDNQFAPSNGTGVGDIAGNFGLGISETLARNINITKVMHSSSFSGFSTGSGPNLPETLHAAGIGIGQGAAQGLGVMKQKSSVDIASTDSSLDLPGAVEIFSSGLTSSLLESTDLSRVTEKLQQSSVSTNTVDIPTLVGGLARGLVDGVASALSSAGGIGNLLGGNASFSALMQQPTDLGSNLDNTASGASTAFGRGLGFEGTLVAGALFSNNEIPPLTGSSDISENSSLLRRDEKRVDSGPVINSTFLSFLAQQGVNALQCDGIGGFGSILLGLSESGTISIGSDTSLKLDNSTAALLPTGTSSIELDGNEFDFELQNLTSAKVNGLSLVAFAALLVLHILLAVSAFLFILPMFLILNSADAVNKLLSLTTNSAKSQTWQKRIIFFIFLPMAILGIIFGFVGMGNSQHLRTAHGILGFITFLMTIAYGAVYFFRSRDTHRFNVAMLKWPLRMSLPLLHGVVSGLTILLVIASYVTGFSDLRSFSLCFAQALLSLPITVFISMSTMTTLTAALAILGLRLWIEFRLQNSSGREEGLLEGAAENPTDPETAEIEVKLESMPVTPVRAAYR